MAKFYKMAKGVFSWPAQWKDGQISQNWPWNDQSGSPGVWLCLPRCADLADQDVVHVRLYCAHTC